MSLKTNTLTPECVCTVKNASELPSVENICECVDVPRTEFLREREHHEQLKKFPATKNSPNSRLSELIHEAHGRDQTAPKEESMILSPYNEYWVQMKDKVTSGPIGRAMGKLEKQHLIKLMTKNGVSLTTSSLKRHPCYKDWVKDKVDANEEELSGADIERSREMLQETVIDCIVEDMRPMRVTEGERVQKLIKTAIAIGAQLQRVPKDEDLDKIIPKKDANRKRLMEMEMKTKEELREHLKVIDGKILPAFHTQFNFWKDKPQRRQYLEVMGIEANYRTKKVDTYVLVSCEFATAKSREIQDVIVFHSSLYSCFVSFLCYFFA